MTFFLKDPEALPSIPAPNRLEPTSFLQGLGAGFEKAALENDANFRYLKERERETERMATEAAAQIGAADLVAEGRKRGVAYLSEETLPLALKDLRAQQVILDVARERAQADPTAWQGMDLTDEGMQKRIDARLQAEYRDQQQTLDMMGWGRGVAEFVGGMAGITADVKNAPFLFVGGGSGSVLKVMGREAAINMAAEAAFLPSQFQMAERLNIPDPDVSSQLLMAAAGGAAIGGAVEGFGRAWTYWRGRNQTPAMEEFEAFEMEAAIDAAEEAMLANENPLEAVERAMQGRGALAEEITPKPTALAPEPVSTGPIERPPLIPDEVMSGPPPAAAAQGLAPETVTPQPTLKQTLKGRPKGPAPSNLSTFIVNSGGIWKGSDRGDLAALDYRRPGFLKTKKLERSSAGNNGGGRTIDEMREMAIEAGYLPEGASINDFLDAVSRDAKGQRVYAQADMAAAMDAEAYRAARLDEERPNTATADYLAMEPAPRGLFIDLEKGDGFLTEAELASKVNGWIDESEFATILTPAERAEIIATVQARGGDVEYLVERVLEREADYVEAPDGAADQAPGGAGGADGRGDVPFGPVPGEAGGSGAGQGGRGGADPAQLPGFDRIQTGDAQRNAATVAALQQQSKIRRLDQTRVEDDAGGLFGGAQADMFSDAVGKAARPVQDQIAADLRDYAEQNGNPVIDAGDGKGPRSMTAILDDLDAGDDFADMLDLCGRRTE